VKYTSILVLCVLLLGCRKREPEPPPQREEETNKAVRHHVRNHGPWLRASAVAISPDGQWVLVGYDGAAEGQFLKLWGARGHTEKILAGPCDIVRFSYFLPDGKRTLSATRDGFLYVHQMPSGKLLRSIRAYRQSFSCAAVSPEGQAVLTCGIGTKEGVGLERQLKLWDLTSYQLIRTFTNKDQVLASFLALSLGGKFALTAPRMPDAEGHTLLWDAMKGRVRKVFQGKQEWGGPVAFSPDGKWAVLRNEVPEAGTANTEDRIAIWDVRSGQIRQWLEGNSGWPVQFTADSKQIVGRTDEDKVTFRDVLSGKVVKTVRVNRAGVFAFSLAGNLAVACVGEAQWGRKYDMRVKIWDLAKGRQLHDWEDDTLKRQRQFLERKWKKAQPF
jgi:WD40 repeat protein